MPGCQEPDADGQFNQLTVRSGYAGLIIELLEWHTAASGHGVYNHAQLGQAKLTHADVYNYSLSSPPASKIFLTFQLIINGILPCMGRYM